MDNGDGGNDEENPTRQIGGSSWDWNDDSAGNRMMEPSDEDGAGRKIGNQSDDFTKSNDAEKSRSTSRNYPIGSRSRPPFRPERCWLVRGTIPFTPPLLLPGVRTFRRSNARISHRVAHHRGCFLSRCHLPSPCVVMPFPAAAAHSQVDPYRRCSLSRCSLLPVFALALFSAAAVHSHIILRHRCPSSSPPLLSLVVVALCQHHPSLSSIVVDCHPCRLHPRLL